MARLRASTVPYMSPRGPHMPRLWGRSPTECPLAERPPEAGWPHWHSNSRAFRNQPDVGATQPRLPPVPLAPGDPSSRPPPPNSSLTVSSHWQAHDDAWAGARAAPALQPGLDARQRGACGPPRERAGPAAPRPPLRTRKGGPLEVDATEADCQKLPRAPHPSPPLSHGEVGAPDSPGIPEKP